MVPSTTRRRVLGVVSTTVAGAVAACAERPDIGPNRSATTDRETTSKAESTATTTSTVPSVTTPKRTREPRSGPDPFYVQNVSEQSHCLSLSVTNEETGETPLDGTYSVAPESGLEFPDVGAVDETYRVAATIGRGDTVDATWHVEPCAPEFRGSGSNRAGGLYVDDDSFFFTTNECDVGAFDYPELPYSLAPGESDCKKETATTRQS